MDGATQLKSYSNFIPPPQKKLFHFESTWIYIHEFVTNGTNIASYILYYSHTFYIQNMKRLKTLPLEGYIIVWKAIIQLSGEKSQCTAKIQEIKS